MDPVISEVTPPVEPIVPVEPVIDTPAEDAPEVTSEADKTAIDQMMTDIGVKAPAPKEPVVPPIAADGTPDPVVSGIAAPEKTELELAIERENALRTLLNEMARTGTMPEEVTAAGAPGGEVSPPAAVPSAQVVVPAKPVTPEANVFTAMGPDAIKTFTERMKLDEAFLTKEQLDEMVDKPEHILAALNSVRRKTAEDIMAVLPSIAASLISAQMNSYKSAQDFYESNEDLSSYRDFVSVVYKQVAATNKDKTHEEVLTLTANEARKRLHLKTPVALVDKVSGGKKPAFLGAGNQGGRKPANPQGKTMSQQDHMDGMLG